MDKSLRDVYLRHGINLTRFSNYEAQRLIKILDTSNSQIQGIIKKSKAIETKEKYYRVAVEIKRVAKECHEQLDGQVEIDFMGLAAEETRFVEKALRGANVKADFELPAPKKIWAVARFNSYSEQGHETFETYLNGLSENLYKTWDMQVRAGYLTGMTAKQINRAVLGSTDGIDPGQMQALRRSLETNTKTMVAHLAETARDAVYRENSSLFSGYRYLGTLDTRTCMVCGELDGKIFKEVEDAPALPQHLACRCLLIPVVKGMEEHDEDDTRASMDGPVSANMSYSDWLKTQPDEIVRDILGASRFALYKSGMPIASFVTDSRTLTLAQLAEKEGITLAMPGNSRNDIPAVKIDRGLVDYSNLSYDKAVHKEAEWINEHGNARGNEFASVMSHDNKVLGTWEGSGRTINISGKELSKLIKKGVSVDFLHCHLDGTLFSWKDMNTMCRNGEIDKMMVSLPDGQVHYLTVNNGERPPEKTLKIAWNYNYFRFLGGRKPSELLPKEEADVIIKVVEEMENLFGWKLGMV